MGQKKGIEDNLMVDEVLVKGLGWEVYVVPNHVLITLS